MIVPEWKPDVQAFINEASRESSAAFSAVSEDAQLTLRRFAEAGTSENRKGVTLALISSIFIGASFIIKKKGLIIAGSSGGGARASAGGYSYLYQPLWWVGMLTMIGGEAANLAAYAYAPAIVVTPLGASTIIISAVLAHFILGETMHVCGILACSLAILGSVILVSHAPAESLHESIEEVWALATQPAFLSYAVCVIILALVLIYQYAPRYGRSHPLVYVLICSLIGSLSVVSCKALGIALKLTFRGNNQLFRKETFFFACTVACCVLVQMNYLNKALDTFNTAIARTPEPHTRTRTHAAALTRPRPHTPARAPAHRATRCVRRSPPFTTSSSPRARSRRQ